MPNRVWIMEELNILHTMDDPIIVFVAGVVEDQHRWQSHQPAGLLCQVHKGLHALKCTIACMLLMTLSLAITSAVLELVCLVAVHEVCGSHTDACFRMRNA